MSKNSPLIKQPEKAFFIWHQPLLLEMAKIPSGRELLGIPEGWKDVVSIRPHAITNQIAGAKFTTEFRTAPTHARRIRYFWEDYQELRRFINREKQRELEHRVRAEFEALVKERGISVPWRGLVAGGTDTDFFPDPDSEVSPTSMDANARRQELNGDLWAAMRGGNGNNSTSSATSHELRLRADTNTDEYDRMDRGFYLFDTDSITPDTVDSATFEFTIISGQLTDGFAEACSAALVESSPASNTVIADSDFQGTVGNTTRQAPDAAFSGLTADSVTYNAMTLNATGRGNIVTNGVTKEGLRTSFDADDNEPTWASGVEALALVRSADVAGTSADPKLAVTHTAPGGGRIMGALAGHGGLAGPGGIAGRRGGLAA